MFILVGLLFMAAVISTTLLSIDNDQQQKALTEISLEDTEKPGREILRDVQIFKLILQKASEFVGSVTPM